MPDEIYIFFVKESKNKYAAYTALKTSINKLSEKLTEKHQSHMQCRSGCDLCCMDYSVLPLEFHYIREQLEKEGYPKPGSGNNPDSSTCIFLSNHTCTIYNHRPVICRTHGLPLLYTNDDFEWELSTCELNFREYDYENFSSENTFPQDKINSRLFMLNKKFVAEHRGNQYNEFDRIPLRKLSEYY